MSHVSANTLKDCHIEKVINNGNSSTEAFVFFHGFPADTEKNEDLAKKLASTFKINTFILHYKGLGKSSGHFSFKNSIKQAIEVTTDLINTEGYKKIHIVGHSWGGLVTLNVLREIPSNVGQVVLLNPLTEFPKDSDIRNDLKDFVNYENSAKGKTYSLESLLESASYVKKNNAPRSFISEVLEAKNKLLIIQAQKDVVVNPDDTRSFVKLLDEKVKYIEQDEDHWFASRKEMINSVVSHLKGKGL